MKLAVVGSRGYNNKNRVYFEINEYRKTHRVTEIVSGEGGLVDRHAKEYASDYKLKYTGYPADWNDMSEPCVVKYNERGKYNALAGIKRNTTIAEVSDEMLALRQKGPSPGTDDVVKKMRGLQKPYKVISV